MSKPLVSVLIDTYNHERFIEEAIVSVLGQDVPAAEMEVIVVDDGSTDGTAAIVRKFAPRVRYLQKTNGGQASAFNAGIPETHADIVAFLDGDDWWEKGKLSIALAQLAKHPEVGAVGHGWYEFYSGSQPHLVVVPERDYEIQLRSVGEARLFSQLRAFLGTSKITIRRTVLDRILPIPEELVIEADEYIFTLAPAIAPAIILKQPLFHYRFHGGNLFMLQPGDPVKLRRKHGALSALLRTLPAALSQQGVSPEIIATVLEPIWVDVERMKLSLDGGKPWDTFRVEREAYRTAYSKTSLAYRAFKSLVLLSTLLMPPRQFYRARNWYTAKGLRRLRRVLGEPTPAEPVLSGEAGR
jgi:glycosyltransferase involved in cell wall biosynthesis